MGAEWSLNHIQRLTLLCECLPPSRAAADNFACPIFSDTFLPASERLLDERDLLAALLLDIVMMAPPFIRYRFVPSFISNKSAKF